ncbi:hypothetical protein BN2475_1660005 [Paraburkholderia ribeironis]|uniref:Uncharacterized protein n=1 Tax=Paraburkholderia ribeironis TaxID=1247936 RepID=A0A1N7SQT6_9BURK|nr:hypothetical protein [Paraburkholderia ribeironis]SIT49676.1 hypothetical protein BN2475_1660005 [Paraburkholderia ribeironis]
MSEQGVVLPLNEDQIRQIHSMTGQHVASIRVVADFPGLQRIQGLQGVQGFGPQAVSYTHLTLPTSDLV